MTVVEASPYKSTAEELATLRKMFRLACRCYMERVEIEIIRLHEQVITAGMTAANHEPGKSPSPAVRSKAAKAKNGRSNASAGRRANTVAEPNSAIYDLRDMLNLLRTLEIKPEAGRRKDLKKIESLVEDLRVLSEGWG